VLLHEVMRCKPLTGTKVVVMKNRKMRCLSVVSTVNERRHQLVPQATCMNDNVVAVRVHEALRCKHMRFSAEPK
jgi:hypothetical protein